MIIRHDTVGVDHDHFPWSPLPSRPPLRWPNGARLALSVLLLVEHAEIEPEVRRSRRLTSEIGVRPAPDLTRLTQREYGPRIGVFRVLDVLARHGIPASVAIDAESAERYPYLVGHCASRGAEFVAHGLAVTNPITSAMPREEEEAYIAESLARIAAATGRRPQGWLGPEQSESDHTLGLLAREGIRYVCDWPNDDQPYLMATEPALVSVPTKYGLEDGYSPAARALPPDQVAQLTVDAAAGLAQEGAESGRSLVLVLRPWLIGQPFRIGALDRALGEIVALPGVWPATTGEVARAYAQAVGLERGGD